jgi:hypothetical protein
MPESPPTITIRQYTTGTARAGEPGNLCKCTRTRALTHHPGGVGGAVHLEGSSEGPEGAIQKPIAGLNGRPRGTPGGERCAHSSLNRLRELLHITLL